MVPELPDLLCIGFVAALVGLETGRRVARMRQHLDAHRQLVAQVALRMDCRNVPWLRFEVDGFKVTVLNRHDAVVLRFKGKHPTRFNEDRAWRRALELLQEDAGR
jgi:hypothetical protein